MSAELRVLRKSSVTIRRAEICTFMGLSQLTVEGISAELRNKRGLSCLLRLPQDYLRLESADGIEAWHGPFVVGSGVDATTLSVAFKAVGPTTSIDSALKALEPHWSSNPCSCAAVEAALWDLLCKNQQLPLWQALTGLVDFVQPNLYASALGLPIEDVNALLDVINSGYSIVKWKICSDLNISEQMARIAELGIPWQSIAVDAYGSLELSQAQRLHEIAPGLAWLEDPFSSLDYPGWTASGMPPITAGEQCSSVDSILTYARFPTVRNLNLEVEKLGISHACAAIQALNLLGRPCLMHGRSMILSLHLAAAFPKAVRAVENHLVYTPERLATVCSGGTDLDLMRTVHSKLVRPGCGTEPSDSATMIAREVIFDG